MKKHTFVVKLEAQNNQKETTVLGRIITALHHEGFKYHNITRIEDDAIYCNLLPCDNCKCLTFNTIKICYNCGKINKYEKTN